jgi:hypothetical protein
VSFPGRLKTIPSAIAAILVCALALAPAAFAENGVGLAGPNTDKGVTFFCFGVIIFFIALPIVLTLIQQRLEKRKEQRKSDLERYG